MNSTLNITVDGEALTVPEGISVAAALALTGDPTTRRAVNGDPARRFAAWGSAECRITVDGRRVLACQTLCRAGMQIERSRYVHAAL